MENKKRDDTAALTAKAHGVSARYVRMIASGKREREDILSTYNAIMEAKNNMSKPAESPSEKAN